MARQRAHLNSRLWVLPSLAIPLAISAAAWTTHVSSEGEEIAPNVTFAGLDVSGMAPEVAAAHVGWRETVFLETPVTIDLGKRSITMTAQEIGFDYLRSDTVDAVISARHKNSAWGEFVSWVTTPFDPLIVADEFVLDEETIRERLSGDEFVLESPIEPELTNTAGTATLVPGVDGVGVDIDQLVADLAAADIVSGPVEITAARTSIAPTLSDPRAEALALAVNALTEDGLLASSGGRTEILNGAQIRRRVSSNVEDGEMTVSIDVEGLQQDLERLFPEPQGELHKPRLEVVDGVVQVVEAGEPPHICCSTESVAAAAADLLDGGRPIYELETRVDDDETVVAWADGSHVQEVVAEFTTSHGCCENRVTNIQTMAEAVKGVYLIPGETISFNEFVGTRTREKGYLPAGAIRGGYMTDEVGGGVSQFVTTMFNAAFFAGLELDEYQSHSVYFSRYPFGREATLSVPGPDLVLTNSTDHPVLIWPSYDATSITVTLYSTKHIEVEEIDQRISRRGQCRHSEIDRQRTYPDGRVVIDTIVANYRPAEGIDCSGNQIPQT